MLFCFRFSLAYKLRTFLLILKPELYRHNYCVSVKAQGLAPLHYTLISTSTPLGSSNFIRASIVFEEEL